MGKPVSWLRQPPSASHLMVGSGPSQEGKAFAALTPHHVLLFPVILGRFSFLRLQDFSSVHTGKPAL